MSRRELRDQPRGVTPAVIARFLYVIDTSGVVSLIEQELRPDRKKGSANGRGRPARLTVRALLLGLMLCMHTKHSARQADIRSILVESLSAALQKELGLRWLKDGTVTTINENHVASLFRRLKNVLEANANTRPELSEYELRRRQAVLDEVCFLLVQASIPDTFKLGGSFALDGCGIATWGKQPAGKEEDQERLREAIADAGGVRAALDAGVIRHLQDFDAGIGHRTETQHKSPWYYGFMLHALVRLNPVSGPSLGPLFCEGFVLRHPKAPLGETSLALIDRVNESRVQEDCSEVGGCLARGGCRYRGSDAPRSGGRRKKCPRVAELLADGLYTNLVPESWAQPLVERDIRPVLNVPIGANPTEHRGVLMIAGHPYCPCTPPELRRVRPAASGKLATDEGDGEVDATDRAGGPRIETPFEEAQRKRAADEQLRLVVKRTPYACVRDQGFREHKDGWGERFSCPARAGMVRCPLVKESMTLPAAEFPQIMTKPPAGLEMCTKKTWALPLDAEPKWRQSEIWHSEDWLESYGRRSGVEKFFSALQDPAHENLGPGAYQMFGLPKLSLVAACAAASVNIRLARTYAYEHNMLDGTHPLLLPLEGTVLEEDDVAA